MRKIAISILIFVIACSPFCVMAHGTETATPVVSETPVPTVPATPTPQPTPPQASSRLTVVTAPTVSSVAVGQTVSNSVFIDNGKVQNSLGEDVFGTWSWQSPNLPSGTEQSITAIAVFIPFDTKYNNISQNVSVTVTPADAPTVSISDFQVGLMKREGLGYSLTVPAETTSVTFSVNASGIISGAQINFKLTVPPSEFQAVVATSAGSDTALRNGETLVTLSLVPNEEDYEKTSTVSFSFSQPKATYDTLPRDFNLFVLQEKSIHAAANLAAANLIPIVESRTDMPVVTFFDNMAEIRYNSVVATTLTGSPNGFTLTIPDIRLLSPNAPYTIQDFKVSVNGVENNTALSATLPVEQVANILKNKADSVARSSLDFLYYKEAGAVTENEPVLLIHGDSYAEIPEDCELVVSEEGFSVTDQRALSLTVDYGTLLERMGTDFTIEAHVVYNGISSNPVTLSFNMTDAGSFPYFHALNQAAKGEGEGEGVIGETIVNRPAGSYGSPVSAVQSYDLRAARFVHTAPFGEFYTNIPFGSVSNADVVIQFGETLSVMLYRDNELVNYISNQRLSESGQYKLYVYGASSESAATAEALESMSMEESLAALSQMLSENQQSVCFDFSIVKKPLSDMYYYFAPIGYRIESVTLGGKPFEELSSDFYFKVQKEGNFNVPAVSKVDETVKFSTAFTCDRTPPELTLSGVTNRSTTYDVVFVTLPDNEPRSRIEYFLDGQSVQYNALNGINTPGAYQIDYYDEAGNVSTYNFRVNYSLNVSSVGVVVVFVLGGGALGYYLMRVRSNLRVR